MATWSLSREAQSVEVELTELTISVKASASTDLQVGIKPFKEEEGCPRK